MKPHYGWFFTETDTWRAAKGEHYNDLLNSYKSKHVLKAKKLDTLLGLINANEGKSAEEINKIYDK